MWAQQFGKLPVTPAYKRFQKPESSLPKFSPALEGY
jgi:hypothetical protein